MKGKCTSNNGGKGTSTSNIRGENINIDASFAMYQPHKGDGNEKPTTLDIAGTKRTNFNRGATHSKAEKKQKTAPLCPASSIRELLESEVCQLKMTKLTTGMK